MIEMLKAALARRPLVSFFALGGAAWVVFVALAFVVPRWLHDARPIDHATPLNSIALGLLTLLCCWAVSGPPDQRPRRSTQAVIVVAVVLVVTVLGLLSAWVDWRWARSAIRTGTPLAPVQLAFPSLASQLQAYLANTFGWLERLTAGLVLAGVASSYTVVRRTTGSLIAPRSARVWRAVRLALLVTTACVVVTRLGAVTQASNGYPSPRLSAANVPLEFLLQLFLKSIVVFAWYGFVARRLAQRLAPLAVAVVIGLGVALPAPLAFWASGNGWPWNQVTVLDAAGYVAAAVIGVWLTRRAHGGLLPVVVLFAAYGTGAAAAAVWAGPGVSTTWVYECYAVTTILAAAIFAAAGRMWRRPQAAPVPPAPGSTEPTLP
jgi:hypothetical protein